MSLPLDELMSKVQCAFVGGELVARIEGKHVSLGRRKHGNFSYSKEGLVVAKRIQAEGELKPKAVRPPKPVEEVVEVPLPKKRGRKPAVRALSVKDTESDAEANDS